MGAISKAQSVTSESPPIGGGTQVNSLGPFLRSMGDAWGVKLELNHNGVCNFKYSGLSFSIEIPPHSKKFYLSSCLIKCSPTSHKVLQKALRLNYFNKKTNSYVLALKPSKKLEDETQLEITLCHKEHVTGKSHASLTHRLRNFMEISISLRKELVKVQLREAENQSTHGSKRIHSIVRGKSIHPSRSIPPIPSQEVDLDATPIISNKKVDRKVAVPDNAERPTALPFRQTGVKVRNTIEQAPALVGSGFDFRGERVSAATCSAEEGMEIYLLSKPKDKRRSSIIQRISRMASKKFHGASFGRPVGKSPNRTSATHSIQNINI